MSLTPKQKRLLDFVQTYTVAKGYSPTQREIAAHFRLKSLGSVQDYLQTLERKGYLNKSAYGRRAIQLNELLADSVRLPLLGAVAAGQPIEAIERQDRVDVPKALLKGGENFVLLVKGDSMIEDGIHDGDVVLVERRATASDGATVVAVVRGEATVKRLVRRRGRVHLLPANQSMKAIVARPEDVEIRGVVVALLRRYK
jgi:repressor LexA